ncbi:hypothetical protein G9F32_05190 [Acinetobacter sp. 194]|uniref:hypothetical protein n=1 Tax=Acinetobacter shaoyimingii TaxID=2715164 RepID=UPI00140824F2|nr:hypothetical protein [Acinetobacter shaoyimingii]NHB57431.1 hypothetical protein [Acinetobacter shaoyimingii]
MSYKHNNLMAMRQNFWNDLSNDQVQNEKRFLQNTLTELGIFQPATLEDTKYCFFLLPSIIIVKGYALGFANESVKKMIIDYLSQNKKLLTERASLKIQYRMT